MPYGPFAGYLPQPMHNVVAGHSARLVYDQKAIHVKYPFLP
jgi:hypothetical protein